MLCWVSVPTDRKLIFLEKFLVTNNFWVCELISRELLLLKEAVTASFAICHYRVAT